MGDVEAVGMVLGKDADFRESKIGGHATAAVESPEGVEKHDTHSQKGRIEARTSQSRVGPAVFSRQAARQADRTVESRRKRDGERGGDGLSIHLRAGQPSHGVGNTLEENAQTGH